MNPSARDRKGLVYNLKPFSNPVWRVEVNATMGNAPKSVRGNEGMAFYFLRDIPEKQAKGYFFGYNNKFNGVAITLNTMMQ